MKKVLAVIAAALAACMLALFVGCGAADVEGKTFRYERCEISGNIGGMNDEALDKAESLVDAMMLGTTIVFANGKATMSMSGQPGSAVDYTQDGNTVTIRGQVFTVNGNTLVMELDGATVGIGGVTYKVYFKA